MSRLKNLLCIIPYPLFPTTGAGKKSILSFNNFLAEYIEVHAVNTAYPEKTAAKFDLIGLFSHSKLRYINVFNVPRIRKVIKDTGADFVLIEHPYMAWIGMMLGRSGIKWGIRSHNIEYARFKDFGKWWWPIMKRYELYAYKKADAVFFITEDDREYAEKECSVKRSFVMPTGMLNGKLPTDNAACAEHLRKLHHIAADEKILLYNGALDYKPNREALDAILQHINPILEQTTAFKYKLIVCGSNLDKSYNKLEAYKGHNIIYCGFVDDITVYFKGADVYLNPVVGGGGIKTRLVEAVSYNTNVVSTVNGSIGFNKDTVEKKITIVPDGDWRQFAAAITAMSTTAKKDTTTAFYEYYYWHSIIARFIQQVNTVIA